MSHWQDFVVSTGPKHVRKIGQSRKMPWTWTWNAEGSSPSSAIFGKAPEASRSLSFSSVKWA
jgi:hypothetical protein